uniref:Uncharacterized protein n=1 Tax=Cyclophora tenuis TaxID=216820 RepID=A0A7S1GPA0_CYCTE|mmetsp:Transcript_4043/g.6921  ORF Transcript_4043/g.6921 Transcript_4043/m.6921 type:complete len:598 (+) Transcript_4043:2-1795(+)
MTMLGPRAALEPVFVKASSFSRKRAGANAKPTSQVPTSASRTIMIYGLLILPLVLAASVPIVLQPLVGILSGRAARGGYYSPSTPASEVFGFGATLWGLSMLSMLNHYLPDGGGENWKKASALAFLMGLGLIISAPTLPDWVLRGKKSSRQALNPYAAMSSLGASISNTGRSGAGGWGLVTAALGALLAITGPLDLREKSASDKLVLARTMLFSLMFGCGVAWFITLQCMSEEAFLPLFVTTAACMAMAFFGTVAGVLGYSLELEEFQDAVQIAQVWAVAFPIFGLTAATAQFARNVAHPFGVGGWLSTYLLVCGCVAMGFTLAMRSRLAKSAATRGLSNLSCVFAWICSIVILFGRYGVAGLDANYSVTAILGIPAPVVGTLALSVILVAVEGETSGTQRGRQRVGRSTKPAATSFGITFKDLSLSNWLTLPMLSIAVVFVVASLYTILIRGCGLSQVATNHGHVFDAIYSNRDPVDEDLAALAEKNMIHSQALVTSARLASSSFWTAKGPLGPALQVAGLVATLPSLYFILSQMWKGGESGGRTTLTLFVPMNLFPVIVCKGNPCLRALSALCLVVGLLQVMNMQSRDHRSKMRI